MKTYVHRLAGCAPTPLAHYLKALGILRLVSEQADAEARGFWQDERFVLVTRLDRAALERFFLVTYAPTPMVAPWNNGSGFYEKGKADKILSDIASSTATRLASYRFAIASASTLVEGLSEAPSDDAKAAMQRSARQNWQENQLAWLNAAIVVADMQSLCPALFGSGGNEGNFDYSNNFMQRLCELIDLETGSPTAGAISAIGGALFGTATAGLARNVSTGQFAPGSNGGTNSATGFSGGGVLNSWDYVLMMEGAVVLTVAAVRRLDSTAVVGAAAPFAMTTQGAGYPSSVFEEKARGEQWFPLWRFPSTQREIDALMREGRIRTGKGPARNAVDAVRSLASLGTARGIDAFVRYGYVERVGRVNIAVSLGMYPVGLRPDVRQIDEIDGWLDALRRAAGNSHAPAGLGRSVRQLEDDVLAVCRETTARSQWEALLCHLGEAEDAIVRRPKLAVELGLQPLPTMSSAWCRLADDGSAEFRIALAIASQRGLRAHCVPLDADSRWPRFAANNQALAIGPDQVWTGRDLAGDLASIILRRLQIAAREDARGLAVDTMISAPLAFVAQFIDGRLDDERIARLVRGLSAVEVIDELVLEVERRPAPDSYEHADAAHGLFRLLYLPASYGQVQPIDDATPLRLLLGGRVEAASELAVRRLVGRGLRPKLDHVRGSSALGRRLVAALAIPISRDDARLLQATICAPDRGRDDNLSSTRSWRPQ